MTVRLWLALALLTCGATHMLPPTPAAAQQPAAADTAAVLVGVATDIEARGDADLAEALLRHIIARYPGTPAAANSRQRLEGFGSVDGDRTGAIELYVWSTLYGLWLGVAVPGALGADEPEPYGLGLLLGGPAGFFAAQSVLRERALSVGQARAITWGGTWGSWQGYGWGDVFDLTSETTEYSYPTCTGFDPLTGQCLREETVTYESTEHDVQKVFASLLAGGALGIAAGSVIASRGPISPGTATMVNFGSLWGSWAAFALGVIADQDETEDGLLLWTLVGGNAGLVGTALIAPQHDISRTRARLINIAGIVGLLGGFGIDLLVQPESDAVLFGIPLVTSAAGLALGTSLTRDHERGALGGRIARTGPDTNALLQLRDGRVELGVPTPIPTFELTGRGTAKREPALRFTFLDARF